VGKILLLIFSLMLAPGLGLFAALYGGNQLIEGSEFKSIAEASAYCAQSAAESSEGCAILDTLQLVRTASLIALIATLGLPLVYLVAAKSLGHNRDLLARYFPPLVWVVLGILPVLLVLHGLLVWVASWELVQMGIIPSNLKLMLFLGLLGGGLVLAAITIVANMRKLMAIEPLRVTGVVVESHEMPDLFARVARIARRLRSREPERIILGVEPTAYVANMPVRLRGVGDLPRAETLYLPTGALRLLDDAELDALIGHELGHFRGADLEFSSRFAPVYRSLGLAIESVATDEDDEGGISLGAAPALGLLTFMIYTLNRTVNRIGREREFAADQAAVEVSPPQAIASLLVKFSMMSARWDAFRQGIGVLLHRGVGRKNISRDYIAHTRQFMAAIPAEELHRALFEAHTPHPLDTHPSFSQRAAAVGVDPAPVIPASLAAMKVDRPEPAGLAAVEERITLIDVDYYRHPSSPVEISDEPELPPELSFVRQ
jgi:Zn-dependent protease with chaperone function